MKFLVDECLPSRLVRALKAVGHDAVHVVDRGLNGRPDHDVMALAAVEGRILLSADTDFGELLAIGGRIAPSVILFRGFLGRSELRVQVLLNNLPQLEEFLVSGSIVVINRQPDTRPAATDFLKQLHASSKLAGVG